MNVQPRALRERLPVSLISCRIDDRPGAVYPVTDSALADTSSPIMIVTARVLVGRAVPTVQLPLIGCALPCSRRQLSAWAAAVGLIRLAAQGHPLPQPPLPTTPAPTGPTDRSLHVRIYDRQPTRNNPLREPISVYKRTFMAALCSAKHAELWLGGPSAPELAGGTVSVCILTGVANVIPPRWDPIFRHRVRCSGLGCAVDGDDRTWVAEPGVTKAEVVIASFSRALHTNLIAADLDRGGGRVRLRAEPSGRAHTTSDIRFTLEREGWAAPHIRRDSSTILLGAISRDSESVRNAVHEAAAGLGGICGGRLAASAEAVVRGERSLVVRLIL